MFNQNRLFATLVGLVVIGLLCSMAVLSFAINVLALFIVVDWIQHWRKTGSPREYWPRLGPDIALWIYWGIIVVGAYAIDLIPPEDRFYTAQQGKWIFFFYALTAVFYRKVSPNENQLKLLLFLVAIVGVYGIFQSLTGIDFVRGNFEYYKLAGSELYRARGFSHNPMTYGHQFALIVSFLAPFLLLKVFKTSQRWNYFLIAGFTISFLALVFTFTRGAWIGVAAAALVILLIWNKRRGLQVIGAGAIVAILMVALVPAVRDRVGSIFDKKDLSAQMRWQLWNSNWHMFLDRPLLGVGAARTIHEVESYNIRLDGHSLIKANSHNNVLHLLAGTGIFGFITWAVAFGWFFVSAFRSYKASTDPFARALHLGCIGAMVAFHVGGMTQTTFDDTEVRTLLCVWLAMSLSHARLKSSS